MNQEKYILLGVNPDEQLSITQLLAHFPPPPSVGCVKRNGRIKPVKSGGHETTKQICLGLKDKWKEREESKTGDVTAITHHFLWAERYPDSSQVKDG